MSKVKTEGWQGKGSGRRSKRQVTVQKIRSQGKVSGQRPQKRVKQKTWMGSQMKGGSKAGVTRQKRGSQGNDGDNSQKDGSHGNRSGHYKGWGHGCRVKGQKEVTKQKIGSQMKENPRR